MNRLRHLYFKTLSRALLAVTIGGALFIVLIPTAQAAPVLSNITILQTSSTGATLTWDTDILTCATINYGTISGALGSQDTESSCPKTTGHTHALSGLLPNTRYYFQIIAGCFAGGCGVTASPELSVFTATVPFLLSLNSVNASSATVAPLGGPITDRFSACLGPQALCAPWPYTNTTFWTTDTASPWSVTLNNLRSSRSYTVSGRGETNGQVGFAETSGIVTWPGFQTAATAQNVTPTSADIVWNTVFPGNSEVYFGKNPPWWELEYTAPGGADTFLSASVDGNSTVWGATFSGKLFYRDPNCGFQPCWRQHATVFPQPLRGVDFNHNEGWIVGDNGFSARTTDNGLNWTTFGFPGGASNMRTVYVPTIGQAWATGYDQKIFHWSGGAWTQVFNGNPTPDLFWGLYTLDNKVIYVGGTNCRFVKSVDGGSVWANVALPGCPGGTIIYSIVSLDGQTIWVGGSSGKLWRSTDSGSTWPAVTSGTVNTIISLLQVRPDELYVGTLLDVGHTNNASAAAPSFSYTADLQADIAGNANDLTMTHGAEIIGVGSNKVASLSHCHGPGLGCQNLAPVDPVLKNNHLIKLLNLESGVHIYYSAISTGSGVTSGVFDDFPLASPDLIPPTISFTNPAASPKYTNLSPYPVTGVAADTPPGIVQTVTLTSNGAPQAVAGTNNWSANVPLVVGNNALLAEATDGGNNKAQANATLVFDNQAPVVNITNPVGGSTVNADPTTADGTATDDDQVVTPMKYSLNSGPRKDFNVAAGSPVNWTTPVDGLTPVPGNNTLVVYAKDRAGNEGSDTVIFNYEAPTFNVTAVPATQTINTGDVAIYTITVTSIGGFAGNVALSAAGNPGNSTVAFVPVSVVLPPGGAVNSTMTVTTNAATATGNFTITITGTSGPTTDSTTVELIVNLAPNFTISAAPDPLTLVAGQSGSYQVTISANATFNGVVSLDPAVAGLPLNATGTYSQLNVALLPSQSKQLVLSITTQFTTPNGSYPLTITGTSGALTRTHTVTLNISPPPDLDLVLQPAIRNVIAGGPPTSYNGTATAKNGFNELTNLSVSVNPAEPNITPTLIVTQITPAMWAGSATQLFVLNVSTTSAVPAGNYQLTVQADYNDINGNPTSKVAIVTLQVGADVTPPQIFNIQAWPDWNNVRITWETDEPANSQIILYQDVGQTIPIATVSDIATYCTDVCHNMYYGPPAPPPGPQIPALTPLTTYYFSVTSVDQAPVPPPAGDCPTAGNCTTVKLQLGAPLEFTTKDEPDFIPPVILTFDSPAAGTTVAGTVSVIGTASDNKAVSEVRLTITPQAGGAPTLMIIPCVGAVCTFNGNWNTGGVQNGLYDLTVEARDTVNWSAPVTHNNIRVENDTSAPDLSCGLPEAINLFCDPGLPVNSRCKITIHWCTDDLSTSEVDYGFTSGYGTNKKYDDTDPADASPKYTDHNVTLAGLKENQLYHYRVTSCNVSGLCAN